MIDELQNAIEILQNALKTDEDYRLGWQANIAMAYHDVYYSLGKSKPNGQELHDIFNKAADNFLTQLCK